MAIIDTENDADETIASGVTRDSMQNVPEAMAMHNDTAPGQSTSGFELTFSFGTDITIPSTPTAPGIKLMKNIQCHVVISRMKPPTAGPSANPNAVPAVIIPRPVPNLLIERYLVQHIGPAAEIMAAPRPWTTRAVTSIMKDEERPQTREDTVNIVNPIVMIRLTLTVDAIFANGTNVLASTSM